MDIEALTAVMLGIHQTLAYTVAPEFGISDLEAAALAQSIGNVKRHFPWLDDLASQKAMDIGAFIAVAGRLYVPRYFAYKARMATPVYSAQETEQAKEYPLAA